MDKDEIKTEIVRVCDVVKDPTHPVMVNVQRNFETKPGGQVTCKCCKKNYERGDWDFYNLCDECFKPFDLQRHMYRFTNKTIEDVDKWVALGICNHLGVIYYGAPKKGKCTHSGDGAEK